MPTWRQVDMAAARLCVTSGGTVTARVRGARELSHGGGRAGSVSARRAASTGCSGCDRLAGRARALAARGAERKHVGLQSHSPPIQVATTCAHAPCAISAEARSRYSGATARTLMIGGCAYARAFPAVRLWWVEGEGALWDFVQQQSAWLRRRRQQKKLTLCSALSAAMRPPPSLLQNPAKVGTCLSSTQP